MIALLMLTACGGDATPLGMILETDGVTYAGSAVIDITPLITETWDDLDEDNIFKGCMDDPGGSECNGEPFDDANGNDWFDAIWIGGFSPLRPANEVHDPVYARATVISQDGEYIAFVSLDLVGLGSPRIYDAKKRLGAQGFDEDRLIVASSHNHQGPDTMGLWGNPFNLSDPVSGTHPWYQSLVSYAIEYSVRDAAANMQPVTLSVGTEWMRDRSPYFNGAAFGGRNPTSRMHGMIDDHRDPVVVSDQLLVIQGVATGGDTVFTLTNWSGHPEVRGSDNNAISSDWVGVTREVLEAYYGGVAMHLPECLGGMMSALGGDLPLVEDDGTHVYQTCSAEAVADAGDAECYGRAEGDTRIDEDGLEVPVWAEHDSWAFVTSHGWHIAEAAIDALVASEELEGTPLRVEGESYYLPIENDAYNLLGPSGIFDLGLEDAITDPALCPEAADSDMGCLETTTWRMQLGPVGFIGVPGELLPELAWGFPDDPQWVLESSDPSARGAGARYFPQHDPDCNDLDYEACKVTDSIDECDCLEVHAWPYELSYDPDTPPLLDLLDTEYRAIIGMNDNYLSYIIPEPDFNTDVSLFSPSDGDHYEDTVSPASVFATRIQEAQARISERW